MLIAVLDADVLFQMVLRDTLLRLAAAGVFRLHWSEQVLEEMRRNLIKVYGMPRDKADALRAMMEAAFPDAMIEGWEPLEATMLNDPKDRHVAAAAKIGADVIVTSNLRHFSPLPKGLKACSPDTFLSERLAANSCAVLAVLGRQAAGYRRPVLTARQLVVQLAKVAPGFAEDALALIDQSLEP
jgi:predicted nucleic acid-binding protein